MKYLVVLAAAALAAPLAIAQTSVGVSVGINQPGVYGRINIGDVPPPALVLPQPVLIARPPTYVERGPIYLYVPTIHQQDWGRYCGRYAACGQPVYFVRDEWVRERYQHEHPGWGRGGRRGDDRGRGRDHDDDRDDHGDRGHGKGHGRGHDKKSHHD